jgi:hypothetical protein
MDVRRFRTEPWMASTKIPKVSPVAGLICRGGHFFLVTFSLGQQRKSYSAAAADEDWRFRESFQSHWIPAFAGMTAKRLCSKQLRAFGNPRVEEPIHPVLTRKALPPMPGVVTEARVE